MLCTEVSVLRKPKAVVQKVQKNALPRVVVKVCEAQSVGEAAAGREGKGRREQWCGGRLSVTTSGEGGGHPSGRQVHRQVQRDGETERWRQ